MLKFWRSSKRKISTAAERWALESPLFTLGSKDVFTIGRAVEGIGILGTTGSGKTSGSGQLIARSFIHNGFGGVVLCGKKGEREFWTSLCADANRLHDLIAFGPAESYRFNFVDFELNRDGDGAGLTENIVNVFTTMIQAAERNAGKGDGGEKYWERAMRQKIRNLTDLLAIAKGRISIPDMYKVAVSAPTSLEQVRSEEWKQRSFCFQCLAEADKRPKSAMQKQDFALVADYYLLEWPCLSEKTRSVVLSTFTSMADVLNRGLLKQLFCGETNVTPKMIEDGKIILVDMPVKEFGEVGLLANIVWKNSFQRSIERRDVKANPRPVFLWVDEAQLFTTEYDMPFQTTARSSRVATVLLTQSISNFYAMAGDGQKGKAQVDSLWGNLSLKIFHANGDAATNLWAAEMIGKSRQYFINANTSRSNGDVHQALFGGSSQSSGGFSEQMEFSVAPSAFNNLRYGGPGNKYLVDGILFSPTMCFKATGKNYMTATFDQRLKK